MKLVSFSWNDCEYNLGDRWLSGLSEKAHMNTIINALEEDTVYITVANELALSQGMRFQLFIDNYVDVLYRSENFVPNYYHGGRKSQKLFIFKKKCQDSATTLSAQGAVNKDEIQEATTLETTKTEAPIAGPVDTTEDLAF